jgi:LuxR family maltose regulon positive regulatory protein
MTEQLSTRELQVADFITQGYTYTQIADELCLSPNTVKTYRMNLYQKLKINTRRELFAKFKNLKTVS